MNPSAFRFECTQCGACCHWEGHAFLFPDDVKRISSHFGMTIEEFAKNHCHHVLLDFEYDDLTVVVPFLVLKRKGDACIYLEGKLCSVHDCKPVNCSQTPFVSEFLLDEDGWQLLNEKCPGMNAGLLHDISFIEAELAKQDDREAAYEDLLESADWDLEVIYQCHLPKPMYWDELQSDHS